MRLKSTSSGSRIDSRRPLQQTAVRSRVGATIIIWTAPDLPSAPIRTWIWTEFPDIDQQLVGIFASFHGLVLRVTASVSEVYEGGSPFTDTWSWTTESIETKKTTPALFEVPPNFAHQCPQIGSPVK